VDSTTPNAGAGGRTTPPFPVRELLRVLLIPLIAVAVFVLLMRSKPGTLESLTRPGMQRVGLVQKDAQFRPIPPADGGATGTVWYSPSGPKLSFELHARRLKPNRRYLIELGVDDAIYTVASRATDDDGELAIDTTLTSFAEGVCVGPNYDPPRPLAGAHVIRFWVKGDGNPSSGSGREHSPQFTEGQDLPCTGNGDGDYKYVLLENEVAHYTGPGGSGNPPS
jgi:hypothetical protein